MSLTKRASAFPISIKEADQLFRALRFGDGVDSLKASLSARSKEASFCVSKLAQVQFYCGETTLAEIADDCQNYFRALRVLASARKAAANPTKRSITLSQFQAIITLLAEDRSSGQQLVDLVSVQDPQSAWIATCATRFGYNHRQSNRENFDELRRMWPIAEILGKLPENTVRDSGLTVFALQQVGIDDVATARQFVRLLLSVKECGYISWFDYPAEINAVQTISRWPVVEHLPDETLKPLLWHYMVTSENLADVDCQSTIEQAASAWFVEPMLPLSIAMAVGSLEPAKRLAAALVWNSMTAEERVIEPEKPFWSRMEELSTLSRSQIVSRLTVKSALPAAIAAVHGKVLSAESQAELFSALKDCANPFSIILELKAPVFVEALQLLRDSGYGGWGNEDQLHKRHAVALAAIFKGGFRTWLRVQRQLGRSIHDATYWLPLAAGEAIRGLGPFLFNNSDRRLNELEMISARWSELDADMRSKSFDEISLHVRSITYPNARDRQFGSEAACWGISASIYYEIERRYLASLSVPVPFPTDKTWNHDELTGRFLKRKDQRGLFLGQHTNCCQHPQGVGKECAWNGQESARAGFFVVEDKAGDIIAQSWTWISDSGALVFDNVESKGLGRREDAVRTIYSKAGNDLAENFGLVLLGTGRSKMRLDDFPPAGGETQPLPSGYDGYSDGAEQVVLARSQNGCR